MQGNFFMVVLNVCCFSRQCVVNNLTGNIHMTSYIRWRYRLWLQIVW